MQRDRPRRPEVLNCEPPRAPARPLAVVQWIERPPPKRQIQVRFLSAGPTTAFQEIQEHPRKSSSQSFYRASAQEIDLTRFMVISGQPGLLGVGFGLLPPGFLELPMGLTDSKLRSLKLPERPKRIFDGDGLCIEIRPNGGKWWRFKYRFDGRERSLSLSTYPEVPLALARARHAEARQLLAAGTDPSAARQQAKHARQQAAVHTLEAVSRDWLAHRASAWTPGTLEAITASLENHVFPALGARPIREVTARDIKVAVQAIDRQGAGETAGRVFQRLRSIYRYALSEDLVEVDPAYPLKPSEIFKPRSTSHRLARRGTCRRSSASSTPMRATRPRKPRLSCWSCPALADG
jgi:hypothetical protein